MLDVSGAFCLDHQCKHASSMHIISILLRYMTAAILLDLYTQHYYFYTLHMRVRVPVCISVFLLLSLLFCRFSSFCCMRVLWSVLVFKCVPMISSSSRCTSNIARYLHCVEGGEKYYPHAISSHFFLFLPLVLFSKAMLTAILIHLLCRPMHS